MGIKLLSICIPTYNRCDILEVTLKNLFANPDFDLNKIEVIVSDNCSTDRTKEVVSKYPDVLYFCNETNTSFYNLITALTYANGKYIKLFNDTFSFKPNMLRQILERINQHDDNSNLFFYPNFLSNKNVFKIINSIPSFLYQCSFYTTWTASIGFWKEDFDRIDNKDKYASVHLPQLNWMYSIVRNGKNTIIYFDDLFSVTIPSNKGGYNLFRTFTIDYLTIVKQQRINIFLYELEKYRLCRFFLFSWLTTIQIANKSKYSFNDEDALLTIFKKYWYAPYFYLFTTILFCRKLKFNK